MARRHHTVSNITIERQKQIERERARKKNRDKRDEDIDKDWQKGQRNEELYGYIENEEEEKKGILLGEKETDNRSKEQLDKERQRSGKEIVLEEHKREKNRKRERVYKKRESVYKKDSVYKMRECV